MGLDYTKRCQVQLIRRADKGGKTMLRAELTNSSQQAMGLTPNSNHRSKRRISCIEIGLISDVRDIAVNLMVVKSRRD